MRIGIFDSGLGGINVLNELISKYPNNEYIFFGDTKNLPYGTKSVDELKTLSSNIIDFLLTKNVDIIIIACGTVSSNCYEYLKNKYDIPLYDIISPTLDYIENTNYHNIGVIATDRTIDSHVFEQNSKVTFSLRTPSFVPIVEDGIITDKEEKEICTVLSPLKGNIDSLILGCTHYPIIGPIIKSYLNVPLIDMGKCLLNKLELTNNTSFKLDLYFSRISDKLIMNVSNNLKCGYTIHEANLD